MEHYSKDSLINIEIALLAKIATGEIVSYQIKNYNVIIFHNRDSLSTGGNSEY